MTTSEKLDHLAHRLKLPFFCLIIAFAAGLAVPDKLAPILLGCLFVGFFGLLGAASFFWFLEGSWLDSYEKIEGVDLEEFVEKVHRKQSSNTAVAVTQTQSETKGKNEGNNEQAAFDTVERKKKDAILEKIRKEQGNLVFEVNK